MAKTIWGPDLRELARRRLQRLEEPTPEEWAKRVEEAEKRGCQLLRFPGLVVEIREV